MSETLLIIDGQKDFMDKPTRGSLGVDGAYQDMCNLSSYIQKNIHSISSIVFTLDSHSMEDIAHAMWWVDENGENPPPYTIISYEDVLNGKWMAAKKEHQEYSLEYVRLLKENGKYKLCVWPYHCIKGTVGHEVVDVLASALAQWEHATGKKVHYVRKGENPYTEHYSGLKAEVVLKDDASTDIQLALIQEMDKSTKIKVAGEARSHCVASTTRDLVAYVDPKKVTLLTDTMSDVVGFSNLGEKFMSDMAEMGVQFETTLESKNQNKVKM